MKYQEKLAAHKKITTKNYIQCFTKITKATKEENKILGGK